MTRPFTVPTEEQLPWIRRSRLGFSLLDVALATVVITMGTLFVGRFFTNVYEQLNPRGSVGGLRRYLMAEQMLKAQAEGLRLLRTVPNDAGSCVLVTPPTGLGFTMGVSQTVVSNAGNPLHPRQLYYFELSMAHGGRTIGTLSMSTLRCTDTTRDDKYGL